MRRNNFDFFLNVSPSFKNYPSTRCATATNSGCSDFDVLRNQIGTFSQIWYYYYYYYYFNIVS